MASILDTRRTYFAKRANYINHDGKRNEGVSIIANEELKRIVR
jgi:hypothetical protein